MSNLSRVQYNLKSISKILSTFFYIGYLPRFQASITSLIGFIIFQFLFEFSEDYLFIILLYSVSLLFGLFAVFYFQKSLATSSDPREVVLDEFFAAALIPFFFREQIYFGLATLILYRVIDILKPGFIKKIDNVKSWIAIYLDDFAAVLIAILFIKAMQFLILGI